MIATQKVFAGIDLGGTRIKIGLVDGSGKLISSTILGSEEYRSAEILLNSVADQISVLADAASVAVVAIGVGCPGRIDFDSGKVVWLKSKLEFLQGIPLARRLSDLLVCPVVCDNDVNTILTGEMRFGAAHGFRDVIALTVGTGIGGALAFGGRIMRGHHWAAGHFGYMSLDPNGPQHVCGNSGIVEEHASQSGIKRQVLRALESGEVSSLTRSLADGKECDLRKVFQAADEGDELGSRLVERLTSEIGVLIANLVYALDAELILVGGGIINHRSSLIDAIRCEAEKRLDFFPLDTIKISPMALGDSAGILGGAAMAMSAIEPEEQSSRGSEELVGAEIGIASSGRSQVDSHIK